ncbi:luciferase domain-containing protein [Streptomyces chartreusis]|uniref:luciferase domain-containing protein n=1 Tax=Streptomyces chartreusis TaxID=1969 RepID=UPI00339F5ED8
MTTSRMVRWGLAGAAFATSVATVRDYERWRALGQGGIPHGAKGWLQVTYLRTRMRETKDPAVHLPFIGEAGDGRWLTQIPHRDGERPRIGRYPVPHRQVDQPGSLRARVAVLDHFDARAAGSPGVLGYRLSAFERHNDAITLLDLDKAPAATRMAKGEVAHIHPGDGSMHMILSPSDAVTALEAGWAERHPLAGMYGEPLTYLMVYSPRSPEEADVVGQLLDAAVGYATGASDTTAGQSL